MSILPFGSANRRAIAGEPVYDLHEFRSTNGNNYVPDDYHVVVQSLTGTGRVPNFGLRSTHKPHWTAKDVVAALEAAPLRAPAFQPLAPDTALSMLSNMPGASY